MHSFWLKIFSDFPGDFFLIVLFSQSLFKFSQVFTDFLTFFLHFRAFFWIHFPFSEVHSLNIPIVNQRSNPLYLSCSENIFISSHSIFHPQSSNTPVTMALSIWKLSSCFWTPSSHFLFSFSPQLSFLALRIARSFPCHHKVSDSIFVRTAVLFPSLHYLQSVSVLLHKLCKFYKNFCCISSIYAIYKYLLNESLFKYLLNTY